MDDELRMTLAEGPPTLNNSAFRESLEKVIADLQARVAALEHKTDYPARAAEDMDRTIKGWRKRRGYGND